MKNNLAIAYAVKRRAKKMAHGGKVEEQASGYEPLPKEHEAHNEAAMMEDDLVNHIMKKRMMAEGGEVAEADDDTHPFEDDLDPDEFDDMVLDDHVERKQPMESNEHGDKFGADHKDMVAEIMMKRKKHG